MFVIYIACNPYNSHTHTYSNDRLLYHQRTHKTLINIKECTCKTRASNIFDYLTQKDTKHLDCK